MTCHYTTHYGQGNSKRVANIGSANCRCACARYQTLYRKAVQEALVFIIVNRCHLSLFATHVHVSMRCVYIYTYGSLTAVVAAIATSAIAASKTTTTTPLTVTRSDAIIGSTTTAATSTFRSATWLRRSLQNEGPGGVEEPEEEEPADDPCQRFAVNGGCFNCVAQSDCRYCSVPSLPIDY